ncbi:MAG: PAS domain S-box protein [Acetobacterium sp.]|uniref:PAS domain S-box protein n=1 Tax=Acetobacterium sp. TaxID=1872094 RepID=UPI003241CB79
MNDQKAGQIKDKESFFEELFRYNQEIMLLIDPDTLKIEDCNRSACLFYGKPYNEMVMTKISHFNCLSEDQLKKEVEQAKNRERNQFYFKHRRGNGEISDVEVCSSPISLDGRNYLFSIVADITGLQLDSDVLRKENTVLEKRVAERTYALKELNDQLITAKAELEREMLFIKALFESIPGYLYVYDEAGRLIKWNKKHEEMTGYSADELANMTLDQWFEGDDLVRVWAAVDDVFKKGYGEIDANLIKKGGGKLLIRSNGVVMTLDGKNYFTGVGIDITESKRLETELAKESKLLETTLVSVGDGVISCDKNGHVLFINRVAEDLTGWTKNDALGKPIETVFNIINDINREKAGNIVAEVIQTKEIRELDNHTILIARDGSERAIEDSAAPIIEDNGDVLGVVLVFRDYTEKKQKLDQIEYLSYHDQLTGLYNRRFYEEELERMDTSKNLPLSLIMGDVNGLKLVNDSFGHGMGDELLKKAAATIKKACRADDVVARLGGDEFVVLLPKTDSVEAEEIITRIEKLAKTEKVGTVELSISFGFETKLDQEEDIQRVFKRAEDYMYRRKLTESLGMRNKTVGMVVETLFDKYQKEMFHSERVSKLSAEVGAKIGLSTKDSHDLQTAGLMHDIGKIGIAEGILDKSEKLSEQDWIEIRRHPEIGYRILSPANEFAEIADHILEHHERWDGSGYPNGLKGEEISLEARIIAIADAYDAMTRMRLHMDDLTVEEAIEEINRCSGTQFDPEIVRVFIDMIEDEN